MSNALRTIVFAVLMSFCTSMIVSAAILTVRGVADGQFLTIWLRSFLLAWPIVFASILTIAPLINRFLDQFVKARRPGQRMHP